MSEEQTYRANRGRKRRLDTSHDETESSPETISPGQNGVSPSSFPQFFPPHQQQQFRQNRSSPLRESEQLVDTSSSGGQGNHGLTNGDGHDPYGEDDDLFDACNVPNDTMATVLSLQEEFYSGSRHKDGKNSAGGAGGGVTQGGRGGERTGVVLQHQIYTVLENRTAVDLELTSMRKENVLRTFRLGTGREDWGVMSTEHYLRVIRNILGETRVQDDIPTRSRDPGSSSRPASRRGLSQAGGIARGSSFRAAADAGSGGTGGGAERTRPGRTPGSSSGRASIARDVLERLVLSNTNAYASRKEVSTAMQVVLLSHRKDREGEEGSTAASRSGTDAFDAAKNIRQTGKRPTNGKRAAEGGVDGDAEDEDLGSLKRKEAKVLSLTSELVRAGFLLPRRDVGREQAYWFSMPQLGKIIAAISRGRKDIIASLKRTRYKEVRRAALEAKNPAKTTGLPLGFHIRDLLGLGLIRELDTPSGMFLRLTTDA